MASANQQIGGGVAQRLANGDYIIDPDIPQHVGASRLRQIVAMVLLPVVVFVSMALVSFDPADPPASRGFPPRLEPVNLCGHLGSTIAALIFQSTGVAGWLGDLGDVEKRIGDDSIPDAAVGSNPSGFAEDEPEPPVFDRRSCVDYYKSHAGIDKLGTAVTPGR